tara:strand:+ start:9098 stop:9262 length:165 start_codon:yes stop_codon:yes gene_type:complete
MIHVRPSILNDLSFISSIIESIILNLLGYNKGKIPSKIKIKENTRATISRLSIS